MADTDASNVTIGEKVHKTTLKVRSIWTGRLKMLKGCMKNLKTQKHKGKEIKEK